MADEQEAKPQAQAEEEQTSEEQKEEEQRSEEQKEKDAEEEKAERKRKRKRRSGWDVDGPEETSNSNGSGNLDQLSAIAKAQKLAGSSVPLIPSLVSQPVVTQSMQNRIYVGNIYYEITEDQVRTIFSTFGPIKSINMSFDPSTGKHKGYCFIEYADPNSAISALNGMKGFELAGRQLKIGRPHNEPITPQVPVAIQGLVPGLAIPNLANIMPGLVPTPIGTTAQTALPNLATTMGSLLNPVSLPIPTPTPVPQPASANNRVYIGSVHFDISEEHVSAVFGVFGKIKSCQLMPNPETGKHKGYGFIEFEDEKVAEVAIKHMDGFELAGRNLKVAPATSAVVGASQTIVPVEPNDSLSNEEELTVGVQQRSEIMMKLSREIQDSPCILLSNLVGPEEVDDELHDEIEEECSKFGKVMQVAVATVNQIVRAFVVFEDTKYAREAAKELNGRYFGGRTVQARLYDLNKFQEKDYTA